MNISVDTKQVDDLIRRKLRFISNPEAALARIAAYAHRSIMKNFRAQGRPEKWAPSRERSRNRKARVKLEKKGKTSRAQQTLRDTGRLMNSVTSETHADAIFEVTKDKIIIGTNVVYAAIHHFGGMAGPGKKVKIPARPYMLIQPEDYSAFRRIIIDEASKA